MTVLIWPIKADVGFCPGKEQGECHQLLLKDELFNSDHKLLANYVPILALRALAHADVYKEKKSFTIERYYYVKQANGSYSKPYQSTILDGKVEARGLLGRAIIVSGRVNNYRLWYQNIMTFSLPRTAHMDVVATLDDVKILDLKVKSDGVTMVNDVSGNYMGKPVNYKTNLRDSSGNLIGHQINLHTEGLVKTPTELSTITKGTIGKVKISGTGKMLAANQYESTEYYSLGASTIMIKSYVKIK
ncbi:MAG: hypothetical protein LW817_07000 [Candidatus Caenarcaniphilales bacterium]|nr:hypothetical protein [Candidatus Caenarcaniphilales bacterium]